MVENTSLDIKVGVRVQNRMSGSCENAVSGSCENKNEGAQKESWSPERKPELGEKSEAWRESFSLEGKPG